MINTSSDDKIKEQIRIYAEAIKATSSIIGVQTVVEDLGGNLIVVVKYNLSEE